MKYPEFYGLLRDCVAACIEVVRGHLDAGGQIPVTLEQEVSVEEVPVRAFVVSRQFVPKRRFDRLPAKLRDNICELPSLAALLVFLDGDPLGEELLVDAAGDRIRDQVNQAQWLLDAYVNPLVSRYLELAPDALFSEERFRSLYDELEDYIERGAVNVRVWAPLVFFTMAEPAVCLWDNLCIRQLTGAEWQELWTFPELDQDGLPFFQPETRFALETGQEVPKRGPVDLSDTLTAFNDAVTALRLTKAGRVWFNVHKYAPTHPVFGCPRAGSGGRGAPGGSGPDYHLAPADVPTVRRIVEALHKHPLAGNVRVALDRFNLGCERERPDDTLIDYWIALEALFLPDEPPQELRYRASLRVAYFVGQHPEDREEIFRQIRRSYDVRSAIVHGRKSEDAPQVAQFTEDVLRRALRRAVVAPGLLGIQELDKLILRGS
ncbi:MAG: HEPN domain-containing protein [Chloroflexota bacterium]|nr:HEPN domain-containing protein [Chloroflexota bacterium]